MNKRTQGRQCRFIKHVKQIALGKTKQSSSNITLIIIQDLICINRDTCQQSVKQLTVQINYKQIDLSETKQQDPTVQVIYTNTNRSDTSIPTSYNSHLYEPLPAQKSL